MVGPNCFVGRNSSLFLKSQVESSDIMSYKFIVQAHNILQCFQATQR